MRFLRTFFFITIIICPVLLQAAEIADDLSAQMRVTKVDQSILVWVELPNVVQGKQVASNLSSSIQTRAERNKNIIRSLKDSHADAQRSVLQYLQTLPNVEKKNIKPHWMVNLIEVKLTAPEIEELAKRSDIAKIYTVPQVVSIVPEISKISSQLLSLVGVESNLTYIRADSAWKLGYTGEGSLVCSFDTGVDGEHPALKHSWNGLDGDSLASWFDPHDNLLSPHFIGNCGFSFCNTIHGSHTMGIMVGVDNATGDTVGVAPGAKWISAAIIDISGVSIVDAFEWSADPDGNPNTSDDVPDVINHSWGIPGVGCENLFYNLIDNSEALGIVNIFAAGNEGAGVEKIRNPANRAIDSLDCFAIGNIDHNSELVATSSSRGPSICPLGAIKPNVSAPGINIRSTSISGFYVTRDGTSMSAPHVSGLVALLRQKNPNATVDEIKFAILNSALPMGQVVPNNDIGWGVIDCVEALKLISPVNATPNVSVYAFDHPQIAAGDNVVGTVVLENRGASVSAVNAVIVGTNGALQVISGSASFGTIAEGDTVRAGTTFEVAVADTVSAGTFLPIDLEITGTGYIDTVKLYFMVEPKLSRSFVTHNVGNIEFTLSNFGTFGLGDGSFFPIGGSGFLYKSGPDDLFEGGLMIGQNFQNVADGIRNSAEEPDGDFGVLPSGNIVFVNPKAGVSQQSFSSFSDSRLVNPLGLEIDQTSLAFDYAPYKDFIILQYLITNRSGATLNNIYVGLYMDWDVRSFNSNSGGYELGDQFAWIGYFDGFAYSDYRGLKVLQPSTNSVYTELGDSAYFSSAAQPNDDGFTELEKIGALANGFSGTETFKAVRKDLIQVVTAKISLADNQTDTVTFALLAGDNYSEIQAAALEASNANLGVVTDIDDFVNPDQLPQSFSLKQNYPNPFNPTTSISFDLPKRSEYKLEIFNLVGQKLLEKVETVNAGKHSFVWDASETASGVYLYKLTVDTFSESKKMVLLK